MGKRKISALCGCLLTAVLVGGCAGQTEEEHIVVIEQETEAITYTFGVAEYGDVVRSEDIRCTYRQMNGQEVSFELSGRLIDKVYVEEGECVKKGDLLAELSGGDLDRRIETLEYRIAKNELLLEHLDVNESISISSMWVDYLNGVWWGTEESVKASVERLQKDNEYTREDYNDSLELDRRELEALKKERANSRVYAEMDGVVYQLKERLEGSTSQKDEVVMTIMDTSQCLFEAKEPDYAGYFREGETVPMTLNYSNAAGQYEVLPWHMEEWGETQLFVVHEGPENTGIQVGVSGFMELILESRENVLCVPEDAIHTADGRAFVYVLGADNMREVKWVETGLYGDDTVEILSGLEEGEKVIRR